MSATPPRGAALETLRALRSGDLLDRAFARTAARLEPRDRAWTHELVYGTVRLRGRIDWLLGRVLEHGVESVRDDVLDVLRLGVYQLREMGSVPAYAAVSQSVDLARDVAGAGASRLTNGVLRRMRRDGDALAAEMPSFETDPAAHLTTRGSHPRWLVERWIARFGADAAREIVEANNRRPELFIRPVGTSAAEALDALGHAGIAAEPVPFAPDAIAIERGAAPADVLAATPSIVQDPAAGMVASYAEIPAGVVVVDACAAPGGKALALADGGADVAAFDVSAARLDRLRENVARTAGALRGAVHVAVADARRPATRRLDAVLVDAPCTGTGTLRRHPDGKWRVGPESLAALVRLQADILDGAATAVRDGGVLVYATCSLETEENEAQVEAFLTRHPEFEPAPPRDVEPSLLDARGALALRPDRHGTDGVYAMRLRRRG